VIKFDVVTTRIKEGQDRSMEMPRRTYEADQTVLVALSVYKRKHCALAEVNQQRGVVRLGPEAKLHGKIMQEGQIVAHPGISP